MTVTTDASRERGRARIRKGRRIDDWRPEDPAFWAAGGARIARRNLLFSIFSEHIGFSVWTLWSVLVLFLGPEYGIDPAGWPAVGPGPGGVSLSALSFGPQEPGTEVAAAIEQVPPPPDESGEARPQTPAD